MTSGVQWRAKILARRRNGRYTVLTVSAPGVAERCRPGHFASVSVSDTGLLLRRQVWIGTSSASGRDGGALELVLDDAEPGQSRLTHYDQGSALDVMAPLGRPFSYPRSPSAALLVGAGSAGAPLIWLAAELGARGSRARYVHLDADEPFGLLDARRLCASVTRGPQSDIAGWVRDALPGHDVVYSAGPASLLAEVAAGAAGVPHQTAIPSAVVCAAGTCTACVIPVTGRDGVARMVRACTEGAVFNADLVRWDDLGTIPPECRTAGEEAS